MRRIDEGIQSFQRFRFHAKTGVGVTYDWEDAPNRLMIHFNDERTDLSIYLEKGEIDRLISQLVEQRKQLP